MMTRLSRSACPATLHHKVITVLVIVADTEWLSIDMVIAAIVLFESRLARGRLNIRANGFQSNPGDFV